MTPPPPPTRRRWSFRAPTLGQGGWGVVAAIIAALIGGYFLWYAPRQRPHITIDNQLMAPIVVSLDNRTRGVIPAQSRQTLPIDTAVVQVAWRIVESQGLEPDLGAGYPVNDDGLLVVGATSADLDDSGEREVKLFGLRVTNRTGEDCDLALDGLAVGSDGLSGSITSEPEPQLVGYARYETSRSVAIVCASGGRWGWGGGTEAMPPPVGAAGIVDLALDLDAEPSPMLPSLQPVDTSAAPPSPVGSLTPSPRAPTTTVLSPIPSGNVGPTPSLGASPRPPIKTPGPVRTPHPTTPPTPQPTTPPRVPPSGRWRAPDRGETLVGPTRFAARADPGSSSNPPIANVTFTALIAGRWQSICVARSPVNDVYACTADLGRYTAKDGASYVVTFDIHLTSGGRVNSPDGKRTFLYRMDPAHALPTGRWVEPASAATVRGEATFAARAFPGSTSGPGIRQVNFTALIDGTWHRICELDKPTTGDVYACERDLGEYGAQSGSRYTVTFDVYDSSGARQNSPDGKRSVAYVAP